MDLQTVFNFVIGGAGSVGLWVLSTAHATVKELHAKVQSIEVLVAGQYVKRTEFEARMDMIFNKLESIENKIDRKIEARNG